MEAHKPNHWGRGPSALAASLRQHGLTSDRGAELFVDVFRSGDTAASLQAFEELRTGGKEYGQLGLLAALLANAARPSESGPTDLPKGPGWVRGLMCAAL